MGENPMNLQDPCAMLGINAVAESPKPRRADGAIAHVAPPQSPSEGRSRFASRV